MQTSVRSNRVLLVEDDTRVRFVLARSVRQKGFEVFEAGSAAAAHAVLIAGEIDTLIVDVNLPDATGWEIARWVQANCSPPPKLIMISAAGFSEARVRELQPDATLSKPFPIDALIQHLERPAGSNTASTATQVREAS